MRPLMVLRMSPFTGSGLSPTQTAVASCGVYPTNQVSTELSAVPVITGGTAEIEYPLKLKDAADALLYLGPRDSLISVETARQEVDGTPYGKELLRRMRILGFDLPLVPEAKESPQFGRPEPANDTASVPAHQKHRRAAASKAAQPIVKITPFTSIDSSSVKS